MMGTTTKEEDGKGKGKGGYMIFRPEKARLWDILKLLVCRRITPGEYVETSSIDVKKATVVGGGGGGSEDAWVVALTLIIQKFLKAAYEPMKLAGIIIELVINFLALNGGLVMLLWRIITAKVVFPKRDSADYRSFIGHIDGRLDLFRTSSSSIIMAEAEAADPLVGVADITYLDLSMMASKVAYENPAYINKAVTTNWKMNFVGFYSCWNKFIEDYTTQAYVFTDKAVDAGMIVVAFRGTETFNARDWSTDVDLSWLFMGKLGNMHLGFLKAMGLQDDKNMLLAFPKELPAGAAADPAKPYAYYAIRQQLRSLLKSHPNAKILVTGHSLGGALACIFPAILSMHNEGDILGAMYGVMTYGQPRVGDAIFAAYIKASLSLRMIKYYRMVYRFDLVPRVPFDVPPVAMFKHSGTCVYYEGWYKGRVLVVGEDAPNPNYFDPLYILPVYFNAWGDLLKALLLGWTQGPEYREGIVSILYRTTGLLIPGIASHSPRDYVNAGRLARITNNNIHDYL